MRKLQKMYKMLKHFVHFLQFIQFRSLAKHFLRTCIYTVFLKLYHLTSSDTLNSSRPIPGIFGTVITEEICHWNVVLFPTSPAYCMNLTSENVKTCHISSKLVEQVQRYGDLTVFKIAAVCNLGFLKFKYLITRVVKRPILHHHTKFRKDRSNNCGFLMAAVRQLGFVRRILVPPTTITWLCKIWLKSMQQFR